MRRPRILLVVLLVLVLALSAQTAFADQVYHSQHVALMPVGGAPLRSGFVENIHADGPNVYAHEQYVVNGAMPDTAYTVTLLLYPASTNCTGTVVPMTTATIETNAAGNGTAHKVFVPSDLPSNLHGATVSGRWELSAGGVVTYQTACAVIHLD